MDRKQANTQTCRTSTGGSTVHGCHACEANRVEMVQINHDKFRFATCSPESYYLSKNKCETISNHSKTRGYNSFNYKNMQISTITNLHNACPVDLSHAQHNLMEMLDVSIKNNVLQVAAHIEQYNKYLTLLTKERDEHNRLILDDISKDNKTWVKIGLDQAFNVTV